MRSDIEIREVALTFITDSTTPQSVYEYSAELEKLGAHGAAIPKLRANKWKVIIDGLITSEKLTERSGCVVASVDSDKLEQLPLF